MNLDNVIYLMPKPNSFVTVTLFTFVAIIVSFAGVQTYLNWKGVLPNKSEIGDPYGTRNFELIDKALSKGWQAVNLSKEQANAKEFAASLFSTR
jgi:hypothetical protein